MARTRINSANIGSVQKNDIDITTAGQALITKVIPGTGISISSTGVDAGTGHVTINATGGGGSTPVAYAETPSGTVNGSNTVFTLVNAPASSAGVIVLINGVVQYSGIDYNISGSTITFTFAPSTGSTVFAYYNTLTGGAGGSSQWTTTGANIYYSTGDVIIGRTTSNSLGALQVEGDIHSTGTITAVDVTLGGPGISAYGSILSFEEAFLQYGSDFMFGWSSGFLTVPKLATTGAAPGTTGVTKMVITDEEGRLSFADTPTGGSGGGLTWNYVTGTTQTAAVDNGYITANNSRVVVTLPATAAVGKIVRVAGAGAGGWRIAQPAGDLIRMGTAVTTTGTGGYLESSNQYDAVELICLVADTMWSVISSQGNITYV